MFAELVVASDSTLVVFKAWTGDIEQLLGVRTVELPLHAAADRVWSFLVWLNRQAVVAP